MENNNCILITKKEYKELKQKAEYNNPKIEIILGISTGSLNPEISTRYNFDPSLRLNRFIHKIHVDLTNKLREETVNIVAPFLNVKNAQIDRLKAEIESLKNRGFWKRLFNIY